MRSGRILDRLMGLPLGAKFGLVGLVFCAPIALTVWLLHAATQRDIDTAASERAGIEYVRPLALVLRAVQAHGLAIAGSMGSEATRQAERDAEAAIVAFAKVRESLDPSLGTAERAKNVVDHWGSIRSRSATMAAGRSVTEHRALSEGVVDLMTYAAERSRLTLDPEARTAYLQDAAIGRLPELVAAFGQAAGIAASKGDATQLAMSYQQATKGVENVNRTFVNAFGGSDVEIGDKQFVRARAAFDTASGAMLEAVGARVRGEAGADLSGLAHAAIDATAVLEEATLGLLDREIDARAERLGRLKLLTFGLVLASLLAGGVLMTVLFRSIVASVREAVRLAGRIAEGDLSQRIARISGDEVGDMGRSLNRMSDRVGVLVADVKASTDAVFASAREVAEANGELASRTERQASSLEEMAASTEELSAAVAQSTQKIEAAWQLVAEASSVAGRSGETITAATGQMQEIANRSREIADISSLIDGIAFQTNILALNAAVEAARVGSEGRGFSVIAGEIRTLSQRSATAAREIKVLITGTVGAIHDGGKLVGTAGETLVGARDSIDAAVAMMRETVAMSREQSASLQQISSAVMELNGVTQQNAAFVQGTTDVAESLERHAATLVEAADGFRLPDGHRLPALAAPA